MSYVKMYIVFIKIYIQTKLEYKMAFVMDLLANALSYVVSFLCIWIMVSQMGSIDGWGYMQLMFLFNFHLIAYGLAGMFFWAPMRGMETMVQEGTFDSMLIYPLKPFWHVVFRQFEHTFLAQFVIGVVLSIHSWKKLNILVSFSNVSFMILNCIGGVLILSSFMIIGGSLSFWITKSRLVVDTFVQFRKFVDYPITIYNNWLQGVLTFILPYAFVNYYPVRYLLKKSDPIIFGAKAPCLTLFIGVLFFMLAYFIWSTGMKRYESTGT